MKTIDSKSNPLPKLLKKKKKKITTDHPKFLTIVAKIVKIFVSEDLLFHKRSCLLKNKK